MTLVISHGLATVGLFGATDDDPDGIEARVQGALSIVTQGYATMLREVVWPADRSESDALAGSTRGGRIYEATIDRGGRWLRDDEAQPMLERLARLYSRIGSFVSFPYDDSSPGIDAVDINFVNDGPTRLGNRAMLKIGEWQALAWPLSSCFMGSGDDPRVEIAWSFHRLAEDLRLVLSVG